MDPDPDPGGPKTCGSGDPESDPDPQHWLAHYSSVFFDSQLTIFKGDVYETIYSRYLPRASSMSVLPVLMMEAGNGVLGQSCRVHLNTSMFFTW
jgi:hypothetical protein